MNIDSNYFDSLDNVYIHTVYKNGKEFPNRTTLKIIFKYKLILEVSIKKKEKRGFRLKHR